LLTPLPPLLALYNIWMAPIFIYVLYYYYYYHHNHHYYYIVIYSVYCMLFGGITRQSRRAYSFRSQ